MKSNSVLIALIHNRETIPAPFMSSLISLYNYTKERYKTAIYQFNSGHICQMRNLAVDFAIKNKIDYIFMVDTDMIYPKDTIERLIKHKKNIIGGRYYTRKAPHIHCHWKRLKNLSRVNNKYVEQFKDNKVKAVEASGGGGVLIKTKIFKNIKYPWFKVDYIKDKMFGEDIYFCKKIKNKYKFYIDPTIFYPHLTQCAVVGENQLKELE